MNIKTTFSWLKEFVETDIDANSLASSLSLTGPSVESITKTKSNDKDDYIYDIEITTNRPDLASSIGIAREAYASLQSYGENTKLIVPKLPNLPRLPSSQIIDIKESDLVPFYIALVIKNVKVAPAREKISTRLTQVGIAPINNIVDISNYVMCEYGLPMHIFDLDKVSPKLLFRKAVQNEKIHLLNDSKISTFGGEIIAESSFGIVDLCGVIGGHDSRVTLDTTNILVWIPLYDKLSIRKTSLNHQIRTQAAILFEKDLDPYSLKSAANRTLELIQESCPTSIVTNIDLVLPPGATKTKITLMKASVDKILGLELPNDKIVSILTSLGFETTDYKDHFIVFVPTFRQNDIKTPIDLIEEVARIYGYARLESVLTPLTFVPSDQETTKMREIKRKFTQTLCNTGYYEVINYSLIGKHINEIFEINTQDLLNVTTSINEDFWFLRNTLVPQIVQNYQNNQSISKNCFFEIGKVYQKIPNDLPLENTRLCLCAPTFLEVQSTLESLMRSLGTNYEVIPSNVEFLSKSASAKIYISEKEIGSMGRLAIQYCKKMELNSNLYIIDIDLNSLTKVKLTPSAFLVTGGFAKIKRDLSLDHNPQKNYSYYLKKITNLDPKLNIEVSFLNTFKDKISLGVVFSSPTADLTQKEVDELLLNLN